jgi:3-deoxy-7-phosphoheptulonate synthase
MTQLLPNVEKILQQYPLNEKGKNFIDKSREISKRIFHQDEKKLAVFVGPCSIHDEEQLIDYSQNLRRIMNYANKNIFVVMRFFPEKARTSTGWKGFFYDPFLDGSNNIKEGLIRTRKLMLELTDLEIPLATEILDPIASNYFKDLITWGFIGSRTSTSQVHRQLASSMPFCVGIKNSNSGDLNTAIDSVISSRSPHSFINLSSDGKTCAFTSEGNHFSHITLRGSDNSTNYERSSILSLYELMKERNLDCPIVVDCAHGNSRKSIDLQKTCYKEVVSQAKNDHRIIGVMLESFLNEGNQTLTSKDKLQYGVSITDPCLSFDTTRSLILWTNEYLDERNHRHIAKY